MQLRIKVIHIHYYLNCLNVFYRRSSQKSIKIEIIYFDMDLHHQCFINDKDDEAYTRESLSDIIG